MFMVRVDALYKAYGENDVLKGIDLRIREGEVVSIIGRSGSGKSTLLRCLNQLEPHDSGNIEVNGQRLDAGQMSPRELSNNVGMIFQSFNLFPHYTVGENVMLAPEVVQKRPRHETEPLARDLLASVGLSEKFDTWPGLLSGGQQQRVAIARALAMSPKVLLCDEVTSALDPEAVSEVLHIMERLASGGMTLILVTHEMRFAREVGNRVVFMHKGRIHEEGPSPEVMNTPQTPELQQFLAASR